jgi:hypothetical protein
MISRCFLASRLPTALGVVSVIAATGCGVRTPLTDGLQEEPVVADDAGKAPPAASDGSAADARDDAEADAGPGPTDAAADVALPTTNLGNVFLTSGAYQSGAVQTLVARAVFYPVVAATGCTIASIEGCTLETCAAPDTDAGYASAGSLAIGGGLYPLVLQPDTGGVYVPVPGGDGGPLTLWHGGEELLVTSSGATVPAFAASVVAPRQVTVLTKAPGQVARDAALPFSWFGASAGSLTVDLATSAAASSYYLECRFDVGAGAGAIPQAALAALPAGVGKLTVSTSNRTTVRTEIGSWQVDVFAQTNANGPDGLEYVATVAIP